MATTRFNRTIRSGFTLVELVLVLTIALLVIPEDVIQEGVKMATAAMPGEAGQMLGEQAARLQSTANAGFAIGGALLALWSASRGAASLSNDPRTCASWPRRSPWRSAVNRPVLMRSVRAPASACDPLTAMAGAPYSPEPGPCGPLARG